MTDNDPSTNPPSKRRGPKVEVTGDPEAIRRAFVGSLKLPKSISDDIIATLAGPKRSIAAMSGQEAFRRLLPDKGEGASFGQIAKSIGAIRKAAPSQVSAVAQYPRAASGEDMTRLQNLLRELHEAQETKREARERRSARQTTWNVVSGVLIVLMTAGLLIEPVLLR